MVYERTAEQKVKDAAAKRDKRTKDAALKAQKEKEEAEAEIGRKATFAAYQRKRRTRLALEKAAMSKTPAQTRDTSRAARTPDPRTPGTLSTPASTAMADLTLGMTRTLENIYFNDATQTDQLIQQNDSIIQQNHQIAAGKSDTFTKTLDTLKYMYDKGAGFIEMSESKTESMSAAEKNWPTEEADFAPFAENEEVVVVEKPAAKRRAATPAKKRAATPAKKKTATPAKKKTATPAKKKTATPAKKKTATAGGGGSMTPTTRVRAATRASTTKKIANKKTATSTKKKQAAPKNRFVYQDRPTSQEQQNDDYLAGVAAAITAAEEDN